MRFIPVSCDDRAAMLDAVGVSHVDELFADVPASARLREGLALPDGMSEIELAAHLRALAARNRPATSLVNFAGAGCYDHHIPAVVDHIVRRPEFFTAYTPYQPEVSQGTLQAIYEYQSMICALTGADVANASMYDGATALVEAALMACRVTNRDAVVWLPTLHPEWRETLATYAAAGSMRLLAPPQLDDARGTALLSGTASALESIVDEATAAVIVQSPNFFGCFEDLEQIARIAHAAGALLIVAANPIVLGVTCPPVALGADIVVGEGQPLGSAMSFGGPGLGFFACRSEHVRQMPGRLVGKTVDVDGNAGYVLTLSTREQHIRREKATSNICSNHALNALAAGVYLAAVGRDGLAGIARSCMAKARYLRERLLETGCFSAVWDTAFGYEFALRCAGDVAVLQERMLERGFLAGVRASQVGAENAAFAGVEDIIVFAVTEKRTRAEIDAFVEEVTAS